jgi:hypothetical protein
MMPKGTAFFVGVQDSEPRGKSYLYLVTAKHVLQANDKKSWLPEVILRLNTKRGDSELIPIRLFDSGGKQNVFLHPNDKSADITVMPALLDELTFDYKVLPENLVTSKKDFVDLKIREGAEVFFTGLFSRYLGNRKNYPIVRFGRVALVTDEQVNFAGEEADLYLVETGSFGGNSGSPVFFYLGTDRNPGKVVVGPPILKLAGVLSGTYLDEHPITGAEAAAAAISRSNMGIAAVVPAYKLWEILTGPELTERRKKK